MLKSSLRSASKHSLSRQAVVFLFASDVEEKSLEAKKINRSLRLLQANLTDQLSKSIEEIEKLTAGLYPHIHPTFYFFPGDSPDIAKKLEENAIFSQDTLRAYISVNKSEDRSKKKLEDFGIPYLVNIELGESDFGWHSSDGLSSAIVRTNLSNVVRVLHDIALDISMFNSFESLTKEYGLTASLSSQFSIKKSKFAQSIGLQSYCGDVDFSQIGYFSLASGCWYNSNEFNHKKYIEVWDSFLPSVVSENFLVNSTTITIEQLAKIALEDILDGYKHSGELSRKALLEDLKKLKRGNYLLMVTRKRPNSKKHRVRIADFVGTRYWKRNLWKIVPLTEYAKYAKYFPNLAFYRFKV